MLLLETGTRGIDFGVQWDEDLHLGRARTAGESGSLLPGSYAYPSVCHWLSIAPIVPTAFAAWRDDLPAARPTLRSLRLLAERADTIQYRLQTRRLFLFIASLTVLWTYLAVVLSRRSWAEGLLAASLVATSFEFATHARWIAPDAVVTSFAALCLACALAALRQPRARPFLVASAVAAGLACGTKYNAGLLLGVVLLAAVATRSRQRGTVRWATFTAGLVAVFGVTVLLTTPGIVLEPRKFLADLHAEIDHYSSFHSYTGANSIYNVTAGAAHRRRIASWLTQALFSPHRPFALGLSALAALGAASLLWRPRWTAAVLLVLPIAYLGFFSTRAIMMVRNLLLVVPFLALLAARGGAVLYGALPWRAWRVAVVVALAAPIAIDARYLVDAAESIAARRDHTCIDDLDHALRADPGGRYRVSAAVVAAYRARSMEPPPNTSLVAARGQRGLVVLLSEVPESVRNESWGPVGPGQLTWFGPREVNLNDYPTWRADVDRAVLLTMEQATRFGVCPDCATVSP